MNRPNPAFPMAGESTYLDRAYSSLFIVKKTIANRSGKSEAIHQEIEKCHRDGRSLNTARILLFTER
jgi:hypothetical protein